MDAQKDINELNDKIQSMKKTAMELARLADDFPALSKNTARILVSLKMLELNISDIADI